MPKVYNKHHKDAPIDAVYVGRPSRWGNPYVIGKDGTREEVIEKYRRYALGRFIDHNDNFADDLRDELRNRDLVCWCSPKSCHADVLLKLANG